jgi:hypothetical protein
MINRSVRNTTSLNRNAKRGGVFLAGQRVSINTMIMIKDGVVHKLMISVNPPQTKWTNGRDNPTYNHSATISINSPVAGA